jgi:hypothetical protein
VWSGNRAPGSNRTICISQPSRLLGSSRRDARGLGGSSESMCRSRH